jgi:type III restriction enzyme
MELKDYQRRAMKQVETYLLHLSEWKKKSDENPELEINFAEQAWKKLFEKTSRYHTKTDLIGRPLPNFCLKIPTGGGKTLLAIKCIDYIQAQYRNSQTGLVLWVVPTTQIYNQTLRSLRNRDHPYRQHLDMASCNRTLILEKTEKFTPVDISENLTVLLLMLPAANRENKETLKMFKDSGGFQEFFPLEDDCKGHEQLLDAFPNLDCFGEIGGLWNRQIKTSLGNTLRLLSPVIILDEGHKAYSPNAQKTLCGFNPSLIVELSATPTRESNVLVDIRGRELEHEEMIKLDLHVRNQPGLQWQDTLHASVNHLNLLEKKAQEYYAQSGTYIRPLMLIQVERTGKEAREDSRYIHSEQVREHLTSVFGIASEEIAVKTSEKDELKEVDDIGGLLSNQCRIRFIITKQALQEGWDCPFAYVLTILSNPASKTSITQLVGRVLRQPYARKTNVKELDESYVYTYQRKANEVLDKIREGFELDGLGDLAGRISSDDMQGNSPALITSKVRDKFQKFAQTFCLPVFAVREGKQDWRPVSYNLDIANSIDWNNANIETLKTLSLSDQTALRYEKLVRIGQDMFEHDDLQTVNSYIEGSSVYVDPVFLARQLSTDIVPNPWISYNFGKKILEILYSKHSAEKVASNFVFIVQEIKKHLAKEKDRLSKTLFESMIESDEMRFIVLTNGFDISQPKKVRDGKRLVRNNAEPVQLSLFDPVMEDGLNSVEKEVACFLDEQSNLMCWYRNVPRQDYFLQGWQRNKIYPDFIFTKNGENNDTDNAKVYVVETKGVHLKNEDTDYKRAVFEICNNKAFDNQIDFATLGRTFKKRDTRFEVVFGDEWQTRLNKMMVP